MKYFLKFIISDKEFAVPIDEVVEVARPKTIQQGKNGRNILGTFDLRRETVFVYDLASILRMKGRKRNEILIADIDGYRIGFCVDAVSGIIEHEQINPVPELLDSHRSLIGMLTIKNTIIPVISLARAVTRASLAALKNNKRTKNKK